MFALPSFILFYIRSIIKWFLRKTTGLCELQRICYGEVKGAPRTKSVELSLQQTRNLQLKQLINHLNEVCENRRFIEENAIDLTNGAVSAVLLVKKINPNIHFQFVKNFSWCVQLIWGYRELLADVEYLRKTLYDADNLEHERKLYSLWDNLMPSQPLESRVTKQWQEIGFQGDDPKTDFRGMGMLGLENLLYFTTTYRNAASHVLSHSHHPVYGYAFAIVGINLTSMAWQLLKDGSAKTYVYNMSRTLPTIEVFHQFYSYLFYEFDKYWIEAKPKNIMEFSNIREKFENNIKLSLQDTSNTFAINLSVDTV